MVKNSVKSKRVYSDYVIAFDGLCLWCFCNDFARNVIIFGVDNSSASLTDNCKNNFLVLGEGPNDDINGSIVAAEKKFTIHFSKAKAKLCLIMHCNGDNSYLFVNRKKICKFKANDENPSFPSQFYLESVYDRFEYVE